MKKIILIKCLVVMLLLLLNSNLKAQTETDNDGVFNISNLTGGAFYNYPISKNTIDGFPINVNLSYNENIMHTAFLEYLSDSSKWYKVSKPLPEWLIGVNGFAVQSFSNKTKFQSWYYNMQGNTISSQSYFNWLIDGYDFNNRMKELNYSSAQDVIKILKDDGSILELRNTRQRKDVSSEFSDSLYTGKYYENALNTNTFAIVEYDTMNLASNSLNIVDSNKINAIKPRKVRLYQGDGLEYVFREINIPYGRFIYTDTAFGHRLITVGTDSLYSTSTEGSFYSKIVKPTIFYLEEINSELKNLVTFKRDGHYPKNDSNDCVPGRARLLEFAGHKLTYGEYQVSLETFGRTYKFQTGLILPAVSIGENHSSLKGSDEIISDLEQFYNVTKTFFKSKEFNNIKYSNSDYNIVDNFLNYQGMVLNITDPENRKISFDYDFVKKTPYSNYRNVSSTNWSFLNVYLTKITQPKKIFEINFATSNYYGVPSEVLNKDYNNIISDYTISNNIKNSSDDRKVKYLFSNNFGYYTYYTHYNKLTKIFYIGSTALDTNIYEYNFRKYSADCIIVDTLHGDLPTLSIMVPEKTVEETKAGLITNYCKYNCYNTFSSSNATSNLNYAPIFTKQYFRKTQSDTDLLIQYQTHKYSFANIHSFDTSSIADLNYSNVILTDTTISYFPTDSSRVFSYDVSTYNHLKLLQIDGIRNDTIILRNETKSANDSIWNRGYEHSVLKTQTKTTTGTFAKPPIYYLETKSEILDSNRTLLGGKINKYQTSAYLMGSQDTARRGALLTDSIIFKNNEIVLANIYKYRSGTSKNFVTARINNLGQTTKNYYDYTSAGGYPNGTKFLNNGSNSTVKLFKEYPEYESPIGSTSYVRKYKVSDSNILLDSTAFTSFQEKTYFGQAKSTIDANGIYSEYQYDKNGRILTEWQPYDFPIYDSRFGAKLFDEYCMRTDSVYTKKYITIDTVKPNINDSFNPTNNLSQKQETLYHTGEVGSFTSLGATLNSDTTKRSVVTTKSETFITYRSNPYDELHSLGSFDSLSLKISPMLLATNKCLDLKLTVDKFNYEQRILIACKDLSNASSNVGQIDVNKKPIDFTFDLTPIKSSLMAMSAGENVQFKISSMSPDGYLLILSQSDDVLPCINIKKFVFDPVIDYTHRYEYNDTLNATNVFTKIDDSLHTGQKEWSQTWNSHFGRYYKVRNFNDMNEKNYKNLMFIGHPDSYTRVDSLLTSYNHLGQKYGAFDQNMNFKFYEYNNNGELSKLHFLPRGSYSADELAKYTYQTGKPDSLVPNYDTTKQNFYNYCTITNYENANSDKVSNYLDAFGLKRIETIISSDGSDTTKTYFNYDLYTGNLTNMVNTVGDTIKYWYDDFGKLKYKYQKDVGYLSFKYDKYGNLRFSQTQQQAIENKVSYFEYDDMLRVTVSGEAIIDTSGLELVEPLTNPYSQFHRLTDILDPNKLNYTDYGSSPDKGLLTANSTMYSTGSFTEIPNFKIDTVNHIVGGLRFQKDSILTKTFMMHPVYYTSSTSPSNSSKDNFENINDNTNFVLRANSFDAFPSRKSMIWSQMPVTAKWDSLLTGTSGNKGKLSISAYRDDARDTFNFVAFQYDARGRVTKLVRYTENLGFDGVFYKYNSLNQIISMRSIDPHRQFITWYGYDNDGKVNKVWNLLDSANSGFGINSLKVPQEPNYKLICLKDSFDIVYTYNKLGQVVKTNYRQPKIEQRYSYNPKGWLDSTIAEQNYNLIFRQMLTRDDIGNITKQVSQQTNHANDTTYYNNDAKYRLANWHDNNSNNQSFEYDKLGNIQKQFNNADSIIYTYNSSYSNRLANTTTSNASILKQYKYNYSGALTSITDTNTSNGTTKIKSQWKYNSAGFLREYTELDTTGFILNTNCNSIFGLPKSVSTLGSIWRYKYSMFGTREQKRLLYSPSGDSCSKQLGWVYYMQGAGGDTRTIYKGKQTAIDTLSDSGRRVYFWADKYISVGGLSFSPDSTKEIEIKDALGSVRALSVIKKNLVSTITTTDYKPFGDSLSSSGALPDDAYIGMELDGERSQYHFNARSYDASLSRFFAPDLLFEQSPNQSPYSYSNNNPVNFKDPSGMLTYSLGYIMNRNLLDAMQDVERELASKAPRLSTMWNNDYYDAEDGYGISLAGLVYTSGGSSGGKDGNAYGGADVAFRKMFKDSGGFTPGQFEKVYNAFCDIYNTTHGKEMIDYIVNKLNGNTIALIGVTSDGMAEYSACYPNALAITSLNSDKYSTSDISIRINNEISRYIWEHDAYYRGDFDFGDGNSLGRTYLIDVLSHELGHVYDYLTMGISNYYSDGRDREADAHFHAYQIMEYRGLGTEAAFTHYRKNKR